MKRVRILVDRTVEGLQYKANQVVDFPESIAKQLIETGEVDDSKGAVKYCMEQLGAEPIVHEEAAERAATAQFADLETALKDANAAVKREKDAGKRAELQKVAKAAAAALKDAKAKA
jgi:hypothetical protein